MKLNHIISIILSSIITITLFTACEKSESIPEETTVSETTAATIPADLTEEEMAIWESMPDIVTMRVYNDFITETTEILYITKYGEMKSFTLEGNSENYHDIEWINEEIENNEVQSVKITPIIQDNTKIARPIYNYTDEMVGKYIVDGKVVQKWIDNLWENKYKDRGDDTQGSQGAPDGTAQKPYQVNIAENEGVYTATITIDFTNADTQYYKLTPSTISTATFSLAINSDEEYVVTTSNDMDNAIVDLTTLSKDETYIIKFEKGTNAQVQATFTLTPIN